jgi:hypothetical protein
MNWYEWLATYQYDVDFGDDTIDLMKQAYVAGLQTAYDVIDTNLQGEFKFVTEDLKKLIEESE